MVEATKLKVEIGLALQGGGALGAYEWGAATALLELMDAAEGLGHAIALKCVAGVSVGAINAACIVGAASRADACRRLAALWDDLTLDSPSFWPQQARRDLSLFGLPGFYAPRYDLWAFPTWTSYYDTKQLIATLDRDIDFAALNASDTAFVATAVDVESGELRRFRNVAAAARDPDGDPPVEIEPRHILASGSLPPQFPWTKIGQRRYWDGGIIDNTPLGDVIDAFTPGDDVDRLLIAMNLYPLRGRIPTNLAEVEDRIHEIERGNRMRQDRRAARRVNALIETIEELAALVPKDSLDVRLKARLDEAELCKIIDAITEIDFQDSGSGPEPSQQAAFDDQFGLRDFSGATIAHRRHLGYARARKKLVPLFENHHLLGAPIAPTAPAERRRRASRS
jgi:predicted acylesterase/phospholipase RssA